MIEWHYPVAYPKKSCVMLCAKEITDNPQVAEEKVDIGTDCYLQNLKPFKGER